jgi:hemoglobin-like flavoprotein
MAINVTLIRESFQALRPHVGEVFEHFYAELFRKHPGVRPLFAQVDLKRQQKALASSIAHIVEYLEESDHVADYLQKMGARHVDYGTREEHFGPVAETLLETLEYYFEENWTPELKESWSALLGVAAEHMIRGMRQARRPEPVRTASPAPAAASPVSLSERVKELAREMFRQALDRELEGKLRALAEERAREILRQAIEGEAKRLLTGEEKPASAPATGTDAA